jgi:tetratricopeptide (TPR) repeat protein
MEPDPRLLVEARPHPKFSAQRFARTAEAAVNARERAFENGQSDPWTCRLRNQAEKRSWPSRWLARLLKRGGPRLVTTCVGLVEKGSKTHKLPAITPTSPNWPNVTSLERPSITYPRARSDTTSRPLCFAILCLAIGVGIFGGFASGMAVGWSDLLTEAGFGHIVTHLAHLARSGAPETAESQAFKAAADSSEVGASTAHRTNFSAGSAAAETWPRSGGAIVGSMVVQSSLRATPSEARVKDETPPLEQDGGERNPPVRKGGPSALERDGREASLAPARNASNASEQPRVALYHPTMTRGPIAAWEVAYARGHQAQVEGDLVGASQWYRQAASLNPEHPAILYDLGYMLQIQGDADPAIELYSKVIEFNPEHPHAYYNLGFLLQKRGDEQSAAANYEKAASITPDNPYIHYNLALIREHRNDLAGAQALYEKVVALVPDRRPGIDAQRRLATLRARAPDVPGSH